MKQYVEFRIDNDFVPLLFAKNEGRPIGDSVTLVRVDTHDARYSEIGRLQNYLLDRYNKPLFFGWRNITIYSEDELAKAFLFRLKIKCVFGPSGEECGTIYNDTVACPFCGANSSQMGPLILQQKSIHRSYDISETYSGEMIISARCLDIIKALNCRNVTFTAITHSGGGARRCSDTHYQMFVNGDFCEISSKSAFGIDPFDYDTNRLYVCPDGHTLGLNILSLLTIANPLASSSDIFASAQFYGVRRGVLRPRRAIFVTQEFRDIVKKNGLKGFEFSVVNLK